MSELVQHALDDRGLAYIKAHLGDGWEFCAALLHTVETCAGEVSTLCPAGTPEDTLYRFRAGGLLKENLDPAKRIPAKSGAGYIMKLSTLVSARARIIEEEMLKSPALLCIVDDVTGVWTDRIVDHPTAFFNSGNVYYGLTVDAERAEIKAALNRGNCFYHGVAAVCADPALRYEKREVAHEHLAKLAHGATFISCLAYGSEGFVNWRRL